MLSVHRLDDVAHDRCRGLRAEACLLDHAHRDVLLALGREDRGEDRRVTFPLYLRGAGLSRDRDLRQVEPLERRVRRALRIADGKKLWEVSAPRVPCSWGTVRCSNAQSQAATLIPGAVFSGTTDGHLRAYSSMDGVVLWDFDTAEKSYDAINGAKARGGALDGGGPVVVNGILYVNSGYGRIFGYPGNLLLAFSVEGK